MAKKKTEDVSVETPAEVPAAEIPAAEVVVAAAPAEAAVEAPVEKAKSKINRHSRMDKFLASKLVETMAKEHGKGLIRRASEHHAGKTQFIPSGILPLDYALGGGWRVGGIHTLWGNKSGGKTTTLLKTIANAQLMCASCWTYADFCDPKTGELYKNPKCECGKYREVVTAYIDVEGESWDEKWVIANGVDPERVILTVPEYAEQSLDVAEGYLRSGDIDIVCLDSLAFLTPEKEIVESSGKGMMGEQPRVVGRGVRKFAMALNHVGNKEERRPTLFFTNQIRMKLGLMFGNPETQPSGMAPQFASMTEVRFGGGKYDVEKEKKEKDKKDGDDEEKVAKKDENGFANLSTAKSLSVDLPFRVEKNKQGAPKLESHYTIILANTDTHKKGSVYDEPVIIEQAEKYGIIAKGGSGKWECAGVPFESKTRIEETITSDPAFKRVLCQRVLSCLLAE